jgi:hypothetical protein
LSGLNGRVCGNEGHAATAQSKGRKANLESQDFGEFIVVLSGPNANALAAALEEIISKRLLNVKTELHGADSIA